MKSDTTQVIALACMMLAAIALGVIAWSMIPDVQPRIEINASTSNGTATDNSSVPLEMIATPLPDETAHDSNDSATDVPSSAPQGSPSSITKWTDGKLGSELSPNGTAVWNQEITSTVNAKIAYNRLSWDNIFYDNMYGGGNVKLQVTMAFTDGGGWDCQRNLDGIGYHGTWAPTTTTWVVTSATWNPLWTLGVTHSYTPDFAEQGSGTETSGLHYRTYE
jgi:hypothetical protein